VGIVEVARPDRRDPNGGRRFGSRELGEPSTADECRRVRHEHKLLQRNRKKSGRRRTPAFAARYADFVSVADAGAQFGRVRDACRAAGRDPESMTYTVAHTVCCGKDDAELRRRDRP
jgi:hypothetical protein